MTMAPSTTTNTTNTTNTENSSSAFRFRNSQKDRTLIHPSLPQPNNKSKPDVVPQPQPSHIFVVCADTQFGMTNQNETWEAEKAYSVAAVQTINNLEPRPLFCCICGDLVDMTANMYAGQAKPKSSNNSRDNSNSNFTNSGEKDPVSGSDRDSDCYTTQECDDIQEAQNKDFVKIWDTLHPDIALVCLCGNHDVGNRPDRTSIDRFMAEFGDDYLAFWAQNTYNIVLNTSLFNDPTAAPDLYQQQLVWLEARLVYATNHKASHIFLFGHHPWFLYQDDETAEDMTGGTPYLDSSVPDSYFHIPIAYRRRVMELFRQHKVSAAFSGHFHQNLVSKSSFGMEMIITSSLSMVFESNGKPADFNEPKNKQGIRIVTVPGGDSDDSGLRTFQHKFISL
jgi:hypothetical protein